MADILSHFGTSAVQRLGGGGEADIYALSGQRVLRLLKPGGEMASERNRHDLLRLMNARSDALTFAIPKVLDFGTYQGRIFSIEPRIEGVSMDVALAGNVARREALIQAYLQAALDLGDLMQLPHFGELAGPDPLVADTQVAALGAIAARSLSIAGLQQIDAQRLAQALPASTMPGLVHVDYYPGNVMCEGGKITGVIDFGYATLAADPRLTAIIGGACLHSRITANASDADRAAADDWLANQDLSRFVPATNRWLAAFWAFAFNDDPALAKWGKDQLGL